MEDYKRLPPEAPIALVAEFTALTGQGDAVGRLLAGLAVNVRQEPGNLAFDCYRRLENDLKFVVYEIYRDRLAFETHIAAEYGAVFNAQLRELIVEPNSVLTFLCPLKASARSVLNNP